MTVRKWVSLTAALLTFVLLLWIASHVLRPISHTDQEKTEQDLRLILHALALYKDNHGRYPPEPEGLTALIGGYLDSDFALKDAWLQRAIYKHAPAVGATPEAVVVYSIGENGIDENGGGDDIIGRNPPTW